MPDYPDKPPEPMREKAERIRAKEERGEDLSKEERGFLGAYAVAKKDIAERKEAEREGHLDEWEKENQVEH